MAPQLCDPSPWFPNHPPHPSRSGRAGFAWRNHLAPLRSTPLRARVVVNHSDDM